MSVLSLEEETLKQLISNQGKLKARLKEIQTQNFVEKYGETPKETMNEYTIRMKKHTVQCRSGEYGYNPWLPTVYGGNHFNVSVTGYEICLPSAAEKEAYKLVYEKEIKIPGTPRKHFWGN